MDGVNMRGLTGPIILIDECAYLKYFNKYFKRKLRKGNRYKKLIRVRIDFNDSYFK